MYVEARDKQDEMGNGVKSLAWPCDVRAVESSPGKSQPAKARKRQKGTR